jgi:hypothetical protein
MSSGSESIHSIHLSPQIDKGNAVLFERAPLRRDSLFRELANISVDLYQMALTNRPFFNMLRMHPGLVYLLRTNPELLNVAIQNPTFLDELINEPQKFIKNKNLPKDEKADNLLAKNKVDGLAKSKTRKQVASEKADTLSKQSSVNNTQSKQVRLSVNLQPHKLESEVMAKAHVENPNTGIPVGDFRQLNRSLIKNSSAIPHDLELQPGLITNARAFALSPELLALMSAQAIATSRTKRLSMSGNPDDDDYEIENESEEAISAEKENIKAIHGVEASEPTHKVHSYIK